MTSLDELIGHHPILVIGMAIGLFYVIRAAYAMRQGAAWALQAFAVAVVVMLLAQSIASMNGYPGQTAEAIGVFCAAITFGMYPKRSRHIPLDVRRQVITNYTSRGRKYDPKQDHIDHVVPFAKGGSHTLDNLRVVPRTKNLKKGSRMPSVSDWL
jgi:uncharacterized membrane protein (UPF0136 family)